MDDDHRDVVPVDRTYLTEILPRVHDLAELKLVLAVLGLASVKQRDFVAVEDLRRPDVVRMVFDGISPEPVEVRLERLVTQAVANGFLLRVAITRGEREGIYVLAATERNRRRVAELIQTGRATSSSTEAEIDGISFARPNVFSLYERHIGPLTPMVAEQLRDAERSYPRSWLERAFEQASEYNRHSWKYVEAILSEWERSGAPV